MDIMICIAYAVIYWKIFENIPDKELYRIQVQLERENYIKQLRSRQNIYTIWQFLLDLIKEYMILMAIFTALVSGLAIIAYPLDIIISNYIDMSLTLVGLFNVSYASIFLFNMRYDTKMYLITKYKCFRKIHMCIIFHMLAASCWMFTKILSQIRFNQKN